MKRGGAFIIFSGMALFVLMLASLVMMSEALKDSSQFSRLYSGLLIFVSVGLVSLVSLIVLNLRQLFRQHRDQIPGARMTARMTATFIALSVTPVLIVYLFSLDFLHRGIDSWFDLRIEQALDDSLKLSRLSLDTRMRELLKQTETMARQIGGLSEAEIPLEIDELRARANASEVTLFDGKGGAVTSHASGAGNIIPNQPGDTILLQLQQGGSYTGLDNVPGEGLRLRVVVNAQAEPLVGNEPRAVQALYPVSEEVERLTGSVGNSYIKYKELSYLRLQLKLSFILVLTLVLLFSVFATVWTAFYVARRQVDPVKDMAQATRAVAEGDYHARIPAPGHDELGFLVASFNDMTQKIAQARNAADHSRREAETQQAYLEAILGRLSSGVLVFDWRDALSMSNISAAQILGPPFAALTGVSLEEICRRYPYLAPLRAAMDKHHDTDADWREQLTISNDNGRRLLTCSGSPRSFDKKDGCVIVFDDVTELLQAQKNAAWSEMALRLAHEIKNPLTPIRLAAERLRHKYPGVLSESDADALVRLTNTIIQQVETMQELVNTFFDYARSSVGQLQAVDINVLIREVSDLFSGGAPAAGITLDLEPRLPRVMANAGRLRQVLNNIVKNALEACESQACESRRDARLHVLSRRVQSAGTHSVEIVVRDSGCGIDENLLERIFEPYVTTKTKGAGLGLAIVKKIIEEHQGTVRLENNRNAPGASVTIKLPAVEAQQQRAPALAEMRA